MQAVDSQEKNEELSTNSTENNIDFYEGEPEYIWLPHLKDAITPAGQGKRISTYTVSLEGWRRGLKLRYYPIFEDGNKLKLRYSLSNGEKTHHFSLSMGDRVSEKAFNICDDKQMTKKYLAEHAVPVPQGKMFKSSVSKQEIIAYAEELGTPLVVKPTDGNAGRGVFANIQDINSLPEIIHHVREELEFEDIIVEKYYPGEEFRIYVIEDRVLGAMNRRPANVIGDGVHTIRQLIHRKNDIRKANPHLTSRLIKIDREIETMLERLDYTFDTIPEKDELVYLREKSNLSTGGDAIDVTELLTPELEKIAINAGKAIPGLSHYGVDMIVDQENNTGVILEVNARPGLGGHMFPIQGEPRDFAKEIIDYYFPETKNVERSPLYFDFDSAIEPIIRRTANSVDLISPPSDKLYGKKIIVSGEFHRGIFRRWIRRQAIKNNFHGFTDILENNDVVIVVVGTNKKKINKFKRFCYRGPEADFVENIEVYDWDYPLLIGFETKNPYRFSRQEMRNMAQENEQLERELNTIIKKHDEIKKSRAWRITYPVRFVLYNIKQIYRKLKNW